MEVSSPFCKSMMMIFRPTTGETQIVFSKEAQRSLWDGRLQRRYCFLHCLGDNDNNSSECDSLRPRTSSLSLCEWRHLNINFGHFFKVCLSRSDIHHIQRGTLFLLRAVFFVYFRRAFPTWDSKAIFTSWIMCLVSYHPTNVRNAQADFKSLPRIRREKQFDLWHHSVVTGESDDPEFCFRRHAIVARYVVGRTSDGIPLLSLFVASTRISAFNQNPIKRRSHSLVIYSISHLSILLQNGKHLSAVPEAERICTMHGPWPQWPRRRHHLHFIRR
jgi:hypothetical protein